MNSSLDEASRNISIALKYYTVRNKELQFHHRDFVGKLSTLMRLVNVGKCSTKSCVFQNIFRKMIFFAPVLFVMGSIIEQYFIVSFDRNIENLTFNFDSLNSFMPQNMKFF